MNEIVIDLNYFNLVIKLVAKSKFSNHCVSLTYSFYTKTKLTWKTWKINMKKEHKKYILLLKVKKLIFTEGKLKIQINYFIVC